MSFINRTFDTTISRLYAWTTSSEDPTGAFYSGPGVFGVDTVGYTVAFVPEPSGGSVSGAIVWQDGAVTSGNVFGSWADLYAAVNALPPGQRRVIVDNTLSQFPTIPAGTWALDDWHLIGAVDYVPYLQLADGAIIDLSYNKGITFENLYINVLSTTVSPITKAADNGVTIVSFKGRAGTTGCWVDTASWGGTQPLIATDGVGPGIIMVINEGYRFIGGAAPVMNVTNTGLTVQVVLERWADLYDANAIDSDVGTSVTFYVRSPSANYIVQTGMLGTVTVIT